MSFGGHVQSMINSLKANNNLLKRSSYLNKKTQRFSKNDGIKPLRFVEYSESERSRIKQRLTHLKQQNKIKTLKVLLISVVVTVLFFMGLVFLLKTYFF